MRTDAPRVLYIPAVDDRGALARRLAAILESGLDDRFAVLLRAYGWNVRVQVDLLRALPRKAGGPRILVSGRADVALAAAIDGVHLPAHGMLATDARSLLGHAGVVGASCHDEAELRRAGDATYVTLSPIGFVEGKGEPLRLEGFARLLPSAGCPVLALGGVGLADVRSLVRCGAHGVAVRRAVDVAPDPGRALREFGDAVAAALAP